MKSNEENRYRFLLFCGVLAPVVMGLMIIIIGKLTPDYSQVSESISRMGTTDKPYAWLLHNGYYVYGVLIGLATYGLNRTLGSTPNTNKLTVLLGTHAFGMVLLAVFPDSINSTLKHVVHDIMSTIAYLPLLIGIFVTRSIARTEMTLKVVGILGIFIIAINLPMPVINMFSPLAVIGGLLQRILAGCTYFWIMLMFLLLYRKRRSVRYQAETTAVSYPLVSGEGVLFDQPQG